MTRQNPDILCPDCYKFDKEAFERDSVRLDTLTVCNCEWPKTSSASDHSPDLAAEKKVEAPDQSP